MIFRFSTRTQEAEARLAALRASVSADCDMDSGEAQQLPLVADPVVADCRSLKEKFADAQQVYENLMAEMQKVAGIF